MTWVNAQNTQEHMRAHTAGGDRAAVQTPVMVFLPASYTDSESVMFSDNDQTNHTAQGHFAFI